VPSGARRGRPGRASRTRPAPLSRSTGDVGLLADLLGTGAARDDAAGAAVGRERLVDQPVDAAAVHPHVGGSALDALSGHDLGATEQAKAAGAAEEGDGEEDQPDEPGHDGGERGPRRERRAAHAGDARQLRAADRVFDVDEVAEVEPSGGGRIRAVNGVVELVGEADLHDAPLVDAAAGRLDGDDAALSRESSPRKAPRLARSLRGMKTQPKICEKRRVKAPARTSGDQSTILSREARSESAFQGSTVSPHAPETERERGGEVAAAEGHQAVESRARRINEG
jgi:hypothetical protein